MVKSATVAVKKGAKSATSVKTEVVKNEYRRLVSSASSGSWRY